LIDAAPSQVEPKTMHPLRRTDREIADSAVIDRILSNAKFATIALADESQPYLVTLSCGYDTVRNRLCFHAARVGRKLDLIAANPRACATVVGDLGYRNGECAHGYESVVMFGTMRVIDDLGEAREAMRCLIGQLESAADAAEIWQRNELDADTGMRRCRMLVFEIEGFTAKAGQ
jgi:nitroimidazol reductase NimA-like FMN-containing flavoprotein (pyridoxamine 5'-phosphate oxidase superfamily)